MNKIFTSYLEKIEKSLQQIIPTQSNSQWNKLSFGNIPECVNNDHLANLLTPCRNLMDLGGKRWRPLLLVLCYELACQSGKKDGLQEDDVYNLTTLVEFVHTASLIHDDIEDGADTRRGKPAAHITYGLDTALNAASWLYFEAPVCINQLNTSEEFKNRFYRLYTQELRRLHLGQAMDIYWHRNPELIPTPQEYTAMVKSKTGTLASLATQIGFLAAGCSEEEALQAGTIAASLGEGFQILDDVINLTKGNPGKKRGDDIVEGKKSLPVLLHLQENPSDKEQIANCMKKAASEGINSSAVEECISILNKGTCISKAKEQGCKIIEENVSALANFFGTKDSAPAAKLIIDLFTSMIPE